MTQPIRKAVFPVAGLGSRFLPATKATPKEMLPIVDKPLIQYAVEEAIAAGVTKLIFVTSNSKRPIEDHFDSNYELESKLEASGKYQLLSIVRDILPKGVSSVYIRQHNQLGLGHAVWCAKDVVGDEPFAVLLADDLIDGGAETCMQRMVQHYNRTQTSLVAVEEVPIENIEKYGVVALNNVDGEEQIKQIVEKPSPAAAPSNLAAIGRYILTPGIFAELEKVTPGAGGEIQLTDAIANLLKRETVCAHRLLGQRYDCGSKLGYLQATVAYALKHPELKQHFSEWLSASCDVID